MFLQKIQLHGFIISNHLEILQHKKTLKYHYRCGLRITFDSLLRWLMLTVVLISFSPRSSAIIITIKHIYRYMVACAGALNGVRIRKRDRKKHKRFQLLVVRVGFSKRCNIDTFNSSTSWMDNSRDTDLEGKKEENDVLHFFFTLEKRKKNYKWN